MHEASIVEGLMQILESQAAAHGVARIRRVNLKVGKLRAVEPQALVACFEVFAEGTVAEGAELVIEHVPAHGRCEDCGEDFEVRGFRLLCPACGGRNVALSGGRELLIENFEAETGETEKDETPCA
jgi:hydrogenase nickel incorporation protein HypA/HybF